jgi:hypothetical protein
MPDPSTLYLVTAVVVLGLVAWVVFVLSLPANEGPQAAEEKKSLPQGDLDPDDDHTGPNT